MTKKLEKNLEVELQPSGAKALLPREHLADSWDNQLLLWRSLEPGDSIDRVMLLKQTNVAVSFHHLGFVMLLVLPPPPLEAFQSI